MRTGFADFSVFLDFNRGAWNRILLLEKGLRQQDTTAKHHKDCKNKENNERFRKFIFNNTNNTNNNTKA